MKRKIVFIFCLWVQSICLFAQPPNNAIFKGGAGDGWSASSFALAGANIFKGRIGDGWSSQGNNLAANTIFKGGRGDGWNFSSFSIVSNSIYKGGKSDGWNFANFSIASNAIYKGGKGDGWNFALFAPAPNNIFFGGVGDGWSKIVYPLGPLPLQLLSFTGEPQGKNNLLKWSTNQEINTSYFELERSADASHFIAIKKVMAAGMSNLSRNYNSLDEKPLAGNNFYRLKMVDADGLFTYSNIVLLRNTDSGVLLSVFPNPTADRLNINLAGMINTAMQVVVLDNAGRVMMQQNAQSSSAISLDVSKYPAGVYLLKLRYNDKEEVIRFIKAK